MYPTPSPPSSPPPRKIGKVTTVPVKLLPRNVDLLSNFDTLPVEMTSPQSPLTTWSPSSPALTTPPPRKVLTRRIPSDLMGSKGLAAVAKELTTQIAALQFCESTDTSSETKSAPVEEADFLPPLENEDNARDDEAAVETKAKWVQGFGDVANLKKLKPWRKLRN